MIFVSIVMPVLLLILAAWFIFNNYKAYLVNWGNELTIKKIIHYAIPVTIKSVLLLLLIILIHNRFHSDHQIELILFILVYLVVAIVQSAYSVGGFVSRIRFISNYALSMFRKKSQEAEDFKNKFADSAFGKYTFIVKLLIIIAFFTVFIPNISVFVVSNIFYFLVVLSLLLLSLLLNNVIYFGLVSLMIFQYDPVKISFSEVNYIILGLSFLPILIGIILETRLDSRMVKIIASRMVKNINFSRGFTLVYQSRAIVVHQNHHNLHYYIYYRYNGIVVVFESLYDAKISNFVVRKMISKGSQYLKLNGEQ